MAELLTLDLMRELLAQLHVAFPTSKGVDPQQMARVYRDGLSGLSGDAVRYAVTQCIREENFFPRVAKLRAYAQDYIRRTSAQSRPEARFSSEPGACPTCGAVPQRVRMQRYARDTRGEIVRKDGEAVLEEFESSTLHVMHDPSRHGLRADDAHRGMDGYSQ